MRITFFDTETSDLPERNPAAEIIAYTTQVWDSGVAQPAQTVYLLPTGPVAPEAAKVNGYTPEEWQRRGAVRSFSWEDATNLQQALHDQIVGGHNVGFDLDMVARTFARAGAAGPKPNYRKVDTQPMAQSLVALGLIQSASLVNVAKYFGVDVGAAHTSDGDVTMTIKVFEKFCLLIKGGIEYARLSGQAL
jgi:DNA polymerase III alpha subunit (gram-positive type)